MTLLIVSTTRSIVQYIGEKILDVNKSDDELFKDPTPKRECPICLLPMPYARPSVYGEVMTYMPCCGKILCCRCVESQTEEMINGKLKAWCPFCRVPLPNSLDEHVRSMLKRIQMNDAEAASRLGFAYSLGDWGLQQDTNKALELWNMAAELGSSSAHSSIADAYHYGQGVEKDKNKAIQHWKIAAMDGNCSARHNLGVFEDHRGNTHIAMKHFMISASAQCDESLKMVGKGYRSGHVTKDDYEKTLQAYQASTDEMKRVTKELTKS